VKVRARRAAAALPGLVLLTGLAACGGDGSAAGGDEARIIDVARAVVTATSGETVCRSQLSGDFVAAVFGDLDTCVRAGTESGSAADATGAAVTDVAVDGNAATAVVTEQGGVADGARGTWGFVRDADGWRVAEWRLDYLRADFAAQFGPTYRSDGADDPFADPVVRSCVSHRFQGLGDTEFRTTAYALLRGSAAGSQALRTWYYDCISGGGGKPGGSTLRRIFEDGLRQADQIPPDVIECVVRKLRRSVSDAEIRAMGESGATTTPAGIQKRIQRATVDCVDSAGAA
jgi:hypothetical protein